MFTKLLRLEGTTRVCIVLKMSLDLPVDYINAVITGGVPYDGVAVNEEVLAVHVALTVVLTFLSCAGIIFSIVCLLFNFYFRNTKYMLADAYTQFGVGCLCWFNCSYILSGSSHSTVV